MDQVTIKAKKFAELMLEVQKLEDVPILYTSSREAEAIKLFANTYLAMRVSFLMNWIAMPWQGK